MVDIARARGIGPGHVLIAFALLRGYSVIPKSTSEARIKDNFRAASVRLTGKDIARLLLLDRGFRFCTMAQDAAAPEFPFAFNEAADV